MERAIRILIAVHFTVIGLSHVVQHRAWAEFFVRLHGMGKVGAFANGFLALLMGSLIVAFHDVWTWPGVLLTVVGWIYLGKALLAFAWPQWALRSMGRVAPADSKRFMVPGVAMVAVAGVLFVAAFRP